MSSGGDSTSSAPASTPTPVEKKDEVKKEEKKEEVKKEEKKEVKEEKKAPAKPAAKSVVKAGTPAKAAAPAKPAAGAKTDAKTVPKTATPAPKPANGKADSKAEVKQESKLAPLKMDEDSDEDVPLATLRAAKSPAKPAAKTKSPAKKAAPKKRKAEEDEERIESEEEDEDDKPKKKKQRRSTSKKKAASSDDEDDDDDDDDEDEDDDDDDDKPKKRGKKKSSSSTGKKKKSESDKRSRLSDMIQDCDKYEMRKDLKPLVPSQGSAKWWNREREEDTDEKIKWHSLEHNGIMFHPPYQPHGVKMKYNGKEIALTPEEEEVATFFAAMLETDHVKKPQFQANFFRDWKKVLAKSGKDKVIKDLKLCDFRPIYEFLQRDREEKKAEKKRPEVKKKIKEEKEQVTAIYGWALVDGCLERVANFKVEPPGLFRGRGDHPKTGTLKKRVVPEDVTINIAKGVPIPKAPEGHKWKGIIHNNTVTWLAYYNDVFGDFKYIWLSASSRFKGENDMKKYEKARKLKDHIDKIREVYQEEMKSSSSIVKQRATAIYLIDKLALRVGNEKDTSEVADTVGCCSLRVEHITFKPGCIIVLDFLGKDSMRYYNEVKIDEEPYNNLKDFCKGKKKDQDVFNITTTALNEHLKHQMEGLTAKVFRTYNASITLQRELFEGKDSDLGVDDPLNAKLLYYNKANREVSILCNHQRTVPKGFDGQLQRLEEQHAEVKEQKDLLEEHLQFLQKKIKSKKLVPKLVKIKGEDDDDDKPKKKSVKKEKDEDDEDEDDDVPLSKKKSVKKEEKQDEKSSVKKEEKQDEKTGVKKEEKKPKKQPELKFPESVEKTKAALERIEKRLDGFVTKIKLKSDTKTVALGTAKINYMDPRITVAWCKAKHVPIEKIFNKALLAKFPWAMEVAQDWRF